MDNQLLKYLFNTSSKIILDQTDRVNENFDKADKIIIWIVGFAIGVFILIFSRDLKNPFIEDLALSISIFSLSVVILGLTFRVISFFTQLKLTEIIVDFVSYSEGFANTPELPTPRKIKESDSLEDIVYYFKEDFKIKRTIPDFTKSLSPEELKEYRQLHINYYNTLSESNDFNAQLKEFKSTLGNYFGLAQHKLASDKNAEQNIKKRGENFRVMLYLSIIFFFLTIGVFIFGTILLLIKII